MAGYPRVWLQLTESSDWLEPPPSPSLGLLVPQGVGRLSWNRCWVLGCCCGISILAPPGAQRRRQPRSCLKWWELVIVIWGLGMPIATNGPAATAGSAPQPAMERKTGRAAEPSWLLLVAPPLLSTRWAEGRASEWRWARDGAWRGGRGCTSPLLGLP